MENSSATLDAAFHALADSTRRAVIARLTQSGPITVTELAEPFEIGLPTFLKHLKEPIYKDKKIIVCGDYNTAHNEIDLARPKANQSVSGFLPEERGWIDNFCIILGAFWLITPPFIWFANSLMGLH